MRFCSSCKSAKPETQEHFKLSKGKFERTCLSCKARKAASKARKADTAKAQAAAGAEPHAEDDDPDGENYESLGVATLEDFLAVIAGQFQRTEGVNDAPSTHRALLLDPEGHDDHERDERREWMRERARQLRLAAEMFEKQAERDTPSSDLWVKSMHRRDVGRDVADLVDDITQ